MTDHKPLTEAEVAEIEKRCEAAMLGPWEYRAYAGKVWAIEGPNDTEPLSAFGDATLNVDGRTLKFITASRTDTPRLIADWRAMHKVVEAAQVIEDVAAPFGRENDVVTCWLINSDELFALGQALAAHRTAGTEAGK